MQTPYCRAGARHKTGEGLRSGDVEMRLTEGRYGGNEVRCIEVHCQIKQRSTSPSEQEAIYNMFVIRIARSQSLAQGHPRGDMTQVPSLIKVSRVLSRALV